MFPFLTSLAEFRARVLDKEEIREADIGHNQISFCYMIAGNDTFSSEWHRECRGICFDKTTGHVTSRSLHKFWNVNERESTLVNNLDWNQVARVQSKLDGSAIFTVLTPDGVLLKSKKTFESDVAKSATRWLNEQLAVKLFVEAMVKNNMTLIFEWTAPDARIVIYYPEAELRLLHIRKNDTGEYLSGDAIRRLVKAHDVPLKIVDEPVFDVPKEQLGYHLLNLAETLEGIEGWVIQFADRDMVKLKTTQYLSLHKVLTFLRERDIAELVIDEKIDDVKTLLSADPSYIAKMELIEKRVVFLQNSVLAELEEIYSLSKVFNSRKDIALRFKSHKLFHLLMIKVSGKDPDIKEYIKKYLLPEEFTLKQV